MVIRANENCLLGPLVSAKASFFFVGCNVQAYTVPVIRLQCGLFMKMSFTSRIMGNILIFYSFHKGHEVFFFSRAGVKETKTQILV